jgi:hypothetical protein
MNPKDEYRIDDGPLDQVISTIQQMMEVKESSDAPMVAKMKNAKGEIPLRVAIVQLGLFMNGGTESDEINTNFIIDTPVVRVGEMTARLLATLHEISHAYEQHDSLNTIREIIVDHIINSEWYA